MADNLTYRLEEKPPYQSKYIVADFHSFTMAHTCMEAAAKLFPDSEFFITDIRGGGRYQIYPVRS